MHPLVLKAFKPNSDKLRHLGKILPMPNSDNLTRAHSLLKESKVACSISDLDTVIDLLSQAAHALLPSHPNLPECLNHFAAVLIARFSISEDLNDVRKAIGFRCGALGGDIRDLIEPNIIASSPNSPAPQELLSSAYQLLSQFRRSLDAPKISTAIFLYEKVKAKQAITHPDRWNTQRALAEALLTRYRATGKKKDLHNGTMLLREQHLFESGYLATLCAAILMQPGPRPAREVALLLEAAGPDDPVARSLAWEGLSNFAGKSPSGSHSSHGRHHSPREEEDEVDDGVIVPLNMVQKHNRNQNLGDMALELEGQFEEYGQIRFLDEAIKLRRKALQSASRRARDLHLDSLATTLQTRFEAVGDQKDIDETVDLNRKALSIRVGAHHNRDISLLNLANALLSRFDCLGNREDIDEAIELLQKLVYMQPSSHLNRLGCLNSLAVALQTRFNNFGVVKDMMEAIQMFRDALAIRSSTDPHRADSLSNLAIALRTRSERSGDVEDMKEAVALHQEALSITPVGHPDRGHALNQLASSILDQFRISGDSAEIDESVKLHRKALALYSPDDPECGSVLDDLANALWTRYFQGNNPRDINESVELHRRSLALYPDPHTSRGGRLHNLAVSLQTRYENLGDPHDITEAIELHREALLLHAAPHPDRPQSFTNLADALKTRFDDTGDQKDIDESIRLHRESIQLQPSDKPFEHAIENCTILMILKSNLANALFDLHGDLEDIEEAISLHREALELHPAPYADRAQWLNNLAHCLESAYIYQKDEMYLQQSMATFKEAATYSSAPPITRFGYATYWANIATKHPQTQTSALEAYQIAIDILPQLAALSLDVRSRHQILTTIASSAIGAGAANCAISLRNPGLAVEFLEASRYLKQFNASRGDSGLKVHRLIGTMEVLDPRTKEDIFLDLLGVLWNEVASPVISALELKKSTNPQRLWWCLTGPLIFLPIHAAGINFNGKLEDCVSNYVISSYTPTLTTLLKPPEEPLESLKMTTVIVPDAPGNSYLAGARVELAEIERRVPQEWHTVVGGTSKATVEATITALGNCSIAHFVCHGLQDIANPLNSGLVLSDGRLGIAELMRRASVGDRNLSLAFLSACETAKGDNSTPDEAMHLAGVMLFAGFRGVIGTIWTMDDRDGPKIAATFYERLFGGFDATSQPRKFPDLAKSAEALHHAVNKLKEEKDATHLRWVPFVHYGL
ncbi:CHAT domain-containing protein [Mycena rebaudengoi]|nr:CHAT domain-containing protein [Mycena rebaudengoi]